MVLLRYRRQVSIQLDKLHRADLCIGRLELASKFRLRISPQAINIPTEITKLLLYLKTTRICLPNHSW